MFLVWKFGLSHGSQHLYGPDVLKKVEEHAATMVRALAALVPMVNVYHGED